MQKTEKTRTNTLVERQTN